MDLESKGLIANFCRNPDGDSRPWCYNGLSENPRFEHCDIPRCAGDKSIELEDEQPSKVDLLKLVVDVDCYEDRGTSYVGKVGTDMYGNTCQSWSEQTPITHSHFPEAYPEQHLDGPYCRNPDGEEAPWCYNAYFDGSTRWAYCSVPQCPEGLVRMQALARSKAEAGGEPVADSVQVEPDFVCSAGILLQNPPPATARRMSMTMNHMTLSQAKRMCTSLVWCVAFSALAKYGKHGWFYGVRFVGEIDGGGGVVSI
jgi:hypothetical protein